MWSVTIQCCGCYSKVDLSVHCLILHLIQSRQRFHVVSGIGESGFFTRACSWPCKHSGYHKTNSVPNLMVHFSSCTMSFWRVHAYLLLLGFLRHWASLAQLQLILRPWAVKVFTLQNYKTVRHLSKKTALHLHCSEGDYGKLLYQCWIFRQQTKASRN